MAKPGLEPGTPQFSVVLGGSDALVEAEEIAGNRRIVAASVFRALRAPSHQRVRKMFASAVGLKALSRVRLDTAGELFSPVTLGQRLLARPCRRPRPSGTGPTGAATPCCLVCAFAAVVLVRRPQRRALRPHADTFPRGAHASAAPCAAGRGTDCAGTSRSPNHSSVFMTGRPSRSDAARVAIRQRPGRAP